MANDGLVQMNTLLDRELANNGMNIIKNFKSFRTAGHTQQAPRQVTTGAQQARQILEPKSVGDRAPQIVVVKNHLKTCTLKNEEWLRRGM